MANIVPIKELFVTLIFQFYNSILNIKYDTNIYLYHVFIKYKI